MVIRLIFNYVNTLSIMLASSIVLTHLLLLALLILLFCLWNK